MVPALNLSLITVRNGEWRETAYQRNIFADDTFTWRPVVVVKVLQQVPSPRKCRELSSHRRFIYYVVLAPSEMRAVRAGSPYWVNSAEDGGQINNQLFTWSESLEE